MRLDETYFDGLIDGFGASNLFSCSYNQTWFAYAIAVVGGRDGKPDTLYAYRDVRGCDLDSMAYREPAPLILCGTDTLGVYYAMIGFCKHKWNVTFIDKTPGKPENLQ